MVDINKIDSLNIAIIRESLPKELEEEYLKLIPVFEKYNFLVTSIHAFENATSFKIGEVSQDAEMESSKRRQCTSQTEWMLLKLRRRQTISKIKNQVAVINSLVDENGVPKLQKVGFSNSQKKKLKKSLENRYYELGGDNFVDRALLQDVISRYVDLLSAYLELKKGILGSLFTMAQEIISHDLEKVDLSIFDLDLESQFRTIDDRIISNIQRIREGSIMVYIKLEQTIEDLTKYNLLFSKVVRGELETFDFDDLEGCLHTDLLFSKIFFSMGGETFKSMALNQQKQRQEAIAKEIVQEMASGNVDVINGKVTSVSKSGLDQGIQKKYS